MIEVKHVIRSEEEKRFDTDLLRRINAAIKEIRAEQDKAGYVYGRIGQMLIGVALEILIKHLNGEDKTE